MKNIKLNSIGPFMLRIGKLTDYAILIVSQMAKEPARVLSSNELATFLHLSAPTVSKILKILAEKKLVLSVRGALGGYHLAKQPTEINVSQVIAAMEGEVAMTTCCDQAHYCSLDSLCTMRANWQTINQMIKTMLTQFSIADMLNPLALKELSHGE